MASAEVIYKTALHATWPCSRETGHVAFAWISLFRFARLLGPVSTPLLDITVAAM
jgi:hypothetical protein